jgi:hypothetical protein
MVFHVRHIKMAEETRDIMKMAVFWVVAPCSLVEVYQRFIRAMEAARTSETLVSFY